MHRSRRIPRPLICWIPALLGILWLHAPEFAWGQKAPEVGYMYPAGGQAGTTVEVRLGGYDWTPDLQYFSVDPRIKIETLGPPGKMLLPPPPYWFAAKGRGAAYLIPREVPARVTIPADTPPGRYEWQVASASGASKTGTFYVGTEPEVAEQEIRRGPQVLSGLPMTVNGRLRKIEEVDRYTFSVPEAGLVACELFAQRLDSKFHGVLEIRDADGRVVMDVADTEGVDTRLVFFAQANVPYTLSLYDVDFAGNAAFVYRLQLTRGPKVLVTLPAYGQRGQTQTVEFVGWGVATGEARLETVSRAVTFPEDPKLDHLDYRLETMFGTSPIFAIPLSSLPERIENPALAEQPLVPPQAITGILADRAQPDRYLVQGTKGESLEITLSAGNFGSPLDVELVIQDETGKELVRNDDVPGGTDSSVNFKFPADGVFTLLVNDLSGKSGSPLSTYRLTLNAPQEALADFSLSAVRLLNLPIGGKVDIPVKIQRLQGFNETVTLAVAGLPEGVAVTSELTIPVGKNDAKVTLESNGQNDSWATFLTITGTAPRGTETLQHAAEPLLLANTLKPRCKVEPVDKDGGRTVHRGTTYPSEVIVTRLEDFTGEVLLQMAAKQGRHRQGIDGWDVVVPPGVTHTFYNCYMPEWLELDRTSRMVLIGVTQVPDPKGNVRHVAAAMDGRITMSLEGALLKVSHPAREWSCQLGETLEIPIEIGRSAKLPKMVELELVVPEELEGLLSAEKIQVSPDQTTAVMQVKAAMDPALLGNWKFQIRGTAHQGENLPVVSQTQVEVDFVAAP